MNFPRFLISISIGLCYCTDQHPNDYIPMDKMMTIHIINAENLVSFNIGVDTTTFVLYKMAEMMKILHSDHSDDAPIQNDQDWLVDEASGTFLTCDMYLQIQDIITPDEGLGSTEEITLRVVKTADLKIAVHITNGARRIFLWAKPTTSTRAIYQYAVSAGILQNSCQFMLCHENDDERFLSASASSPDPSSMHSLVEHLDPKSPFELMLKVLPIPEDQLIFWTFRAMVPQQEMSFWEQAIVDHKQYGLNSQIVANCNSEMWAGKLDLKFVPSSIKSLVLKGLSVIVDFKHLRFVSLKELVLDFKRIRGIDWLSLGGSQLERLRLPAHSIMSADDVVNPIEILTDLRSRGEIQIDVIEFGETEKIMYHSQSGVYLYSVRPAHCMIM